MARQYAVEAHGSQQYDGGPYVVHLDEVAKLAEPYGFIATITAYLHDVVEDTERSPDEIRSIFGEGVADAVAVCTDEEGYNRRERKAKTNAKLAKTPNISPGLIVKACDRLANLRRSKSTNNRNKWRMYVDEHAEFRRAAYRPGICDEIWAEIDAIVKEYRCSS